MKKELKGLYDLCKEKGLTDAELLPYFRTIESNLKTKRYGLLWEEQIEDIASDLKNKFPILVEREDLSIKADPNGLTNCLIEGDNYESLTFLKNSGVKIDCIYIDPPYNTGNQDFVYNDKYIDSEDTWRHSSWLSFMNKRLKLAKELLTEDGVIFISIDDNEQAQLKLLCDSVFGERNFITNISWRRTVNQTNFGRIARVKEYILMYAKNEKLLKLGKLPLSESALKAYSYKDERGKFSRSILLDKTRGRHFYNKEALDGSILNGPWNLTEDKFDALVKEDKIYWTTGGSWYPYKKVHLADHTGVITNDFWGSDFGSNQDASSEIKDIFGERLFDFPKPTSLLKNLISLLKTPNPTILDFFAGSGTTGHAVLALNKEDGGNRKFILCTNNEVSSDKELSYLNELGKISGTTKKELSNSYNAFKETVDYDLVISSPSYQKLGICQSVTYERLRRVINGYTTPKGKEVEGIPSNLKYYKANNLETTVNTLEIEDVVIENIVPFVQFKHNVWEKETVAEDLIKLTSEYESVFVYSNTLYLCDGFYESINSSVKPTTLYIYDGLFEFLAEERLVNVNILSITNEFYKN